MFFSFSLLLGSLAIESIATSRHISNRDHVKRDLLASVTYLQNVVTFEICQISRNAREAVAAIHGSESGASNCVEPIRPGSQAVQAVPSSSTALPRISPSSLPTLVSDSPSEFSTTVVVSTFTSTVSSKTFPSSSSSTSTGSSATSTSSSTSSSIASSPFTLSQSYSGSSFLSGWDFFTAPDPTYGQVTFLGQSDAQNAGLVYTNSNGALIMRTDNTTTLPSGANRNSVRITSKQKVTIGSLVLMDSTLMPYGPTVWPAFWSVGDNWPSQGEIDIVEGVHNSVHNQMTLHSTTGCYLKTPMNATGTVVGTNCDSSQSNDGCGVLDNSASSFGSGWNAAGGGVYAMYWTSTGISIWRFNRANIPSDITSGAPNFQNWGVPISNYDSSTCNMNQFFGPQTLVFDITICGAWAGNSYVWSANGFNGTCSQAVENPANYNKAVFEVNYVKVFTLN